jgi:ribosomal protein S18 acetylase RimI-like enzyme
MINGGPIKPIVRRAVPADAGAIAGFNIALARETEQVALDPDRIDAGVRSLIADPSKGFYIVAGVDGIIAGQLMITYEWSDWRNGNFWWIQSVYVAPQYRRSGIFSLLYRTIEEEARRSSGVCGTRLCVHRHNAIAQKIYEKLGMTKSKYELMEIDFVISR